MIAQIPRAMRKLRFEGATDSNLRYADGTTLMAESEEELRSLLMKVKKGGVKKLA